MDQQDRLCLQPGDPVRRDTPYADGARDAILSERAFAIAKAEIGSWPGYVPTPLVPLTGLAGALGLAAIHYKDESSRFGLGSFKALGGAYAVLRLLQEIIRRESGSAAASAAIAAGGHSAIAAGVTVCCATDGNHGRSVAWGARTFGCACVIYVHATVSQARCEAIAAYGAEVRRIDGNYDDAVRRASVDAATNGWHVVSDTSYPGYVDVPRDVMQGYALMVDEALDQLPAGVLPSHVFVQGGVGGLAAGVCSLLWERLGPARPFFVVVEPREADCLFRSAAAGTPVAVAGALDTIMAGLACGEVSLLAWEILRPGADAFLTIPDASAEDAMRILANARYGDPPIVAGESAVAGLAGLIEASARADMPARLGLDEHSVVLVFGTEGATDPNMYRKIVGRDAAQVA